MAEDFAINLKISRSPTGVWFATCEDDPNIFVAMTHFEDLMKALPSALRQAIPLAKRPRRRPPSQDRRRET